MARITKKKGKTTWSPYCSQPAVLLCSDVVNRVVPEPTYDLTFAAQLVKEALLVDRTTNLFEGVKAACQCPVTGHVWGEDPMASEFLFHG